MFGYVAPGFVMLAAQCYSQPCNATRTIYYKIERHAMVSHAILVYPMLCYSTRRNAMLHPTRPQRGPQDAPRGPEGAPRRPPRAVQEALEKHPQRP
eukprot:8056717-Pyramimonas_sp.AAC.1